MNYPYMIPGTQADPASFIVDNSGELGSITQEPEAKTAVTVDYSQLVPALTLASFWLKVRPGGEPQLRATDPQVTDTLLTFTIEGGIAGVTYSVGIVATTSIGVRTDELSVIIEGECACIPKVPPIYDQGMVSGDGMVIVNTHPRFFVSDTVPVSGRPLDRWYDTSTNSIFECVTNGITSYWVKSVLDATY
jgi:hypothetical protein